MFDFNKAIWALCVFNRAFQNCENFLSQSGQMIEGGDASYTLHHRKQKK